MPCRHIGGVEVQLQSFLTSALYEGEWSASRPIRFIPLHRQLNRSLGGALDLVLGQKNNWLLPGIEPGTVQPLT
jgi:hypothetical protein